MPNLPAYPAIKNAKIIANFSGDGFRAELLDEIEHGHIQYRFAMPVYRDGEDDPCLIITSEFVKGFESHRPGIFGPEGRVTLYHAEGDWGNRNFFQQNALEMIKDELGAQLKEN